jgi:DNA-binding beta-propeller fold protein YncE
MRSGRALARLVQAGAAFAAAVTIAGCGNSYKPVVTPINPSGPASEATSYAVVVSAPSTSTGYATIIDWSGNSIMAYASIGPRPLNFVLDETASTGYTFNSNHTLTNFPIITTLQAKSVTYSTLSSNANPVNFTAPSSGLWAADLDGNKVNIFSGSPESITTSIPVALTPVLIAGSPTLSGQREYALSQNFNDTTGVSCNTSPTAQVNGVLTPIQISTKTVEPTITVGKCPVYAVQTPDLARLFVLNRGDNTISVINTVNNALDCNGDPSGQNCVPFQNQSGAWVTGHPKIELPPGSGPVFAEYNSTKQQLIVANYDGGTISVIDVPLDEYGNDANTYANGTSCSTYAACGAVTGGFGTIHSVKVGNTTHPYPASVTVLYDGTRAYTANQGDDSGAGNGTVTVVNLSSYTVEKTLDVVGHPRTVVSTQNSTIAKVYAASPDSPYVTVIKNTGTSSDAVDTTILVEGKVVDVRVTTQNGSSGNSFYSSRTPGYGQPCSLPPTLLDLSSSLDPLTACRQIP